MTTAVYGLEKEHKTHSHERVAVQMVDDHDSEHEKDKLSHGEDTPGGDHKHEGHGHSGEKHADGIELSSVQRSLADIRVATLMPRTMDYQVYAPGEIKANGYTSYQVSPRVDSVVLRRHVALGNHVHKEQPLVTLLSESVAEAQATYHMSEAEWQRVQQLGRKAVGAKRFVGAQMDYEAAYGRLSAFGLSKTAIHSLSPSQHPFGEYTLNAAIEGVVLTDDFHQGQRVESGAVLMELADEQVLWVEARLAPTANITLPAGSTAQIKVGGETFMAKVTQEAHTIDPETRTRVVRLLVDNAAHRLHPGMFADVFFLFATQHPVLAVPEAALLRSADGDWTVFVEVEPGHFKAQEVELGRSLGQWREILQIKPGSKVVIAGAFFIASQIAKGDFDPHNH
ncbi:MAG: efflux RND transporter periplasmic adaptor subunit [Pseudomonadales bacterium]